jgi:hypothetical protein
MSGFEDEAEILCSTRALPVLIRSGPKDPKLARCFLKVITQSATFAFWLIGAVLSAVALAVMTPDASVAPRYSAATRITFLAGVVAATALIVID